MIKQYMTISNGDQTITIRTNSEHAIKSAIKKLEGDFIGGSVKSISIKGSIIKYTYTDAPQSWGYWQSTSTSHVTIVENTFEVEQVAEVIEAPVAPVIEAPVVEVVAEQVAVKTEQGTVTVDILAAATVEQVAEQVATDAYTAGCDAKFFARTHAARIAKAAGTALTTEVKHLITTVTRRTVDTLDTALMA
jgi:hypothetical protein